MPHRLENRIKELCAKALDLPDHSPQLNDVIKELQAVLHEHTIRLRKMAAERLTSASDRRSSKREQDETPEISTLDLLNGASPQNGNFRGKTFRAKD